MLLEDGIQWAEVRIAFFATFQLRDGLGAGTQIQLLQVLKSEVEKYRAHSNNEFWGLRCIFSGSRHLEKEQLINGMKLCIQLKKRFPEMISGYDIVGHETAGPPLTDFLAELFWFRHTCQAEGFEIPFYFHAGECLEPNSVVDQNVCDAILLSSRRIGHGQARNVL